MENGENVEVYYYFAFIQIRPLADTVHSKHLIYLLTYLLTYLLLLFVWTLENIKGVSEILVKKNGMEWPSIQAVDRNKTVVQQNWNSLK